MFVVTLLCAPQDVLPAAIPADLAAAWGGEVRALSPSAAEMAVAEAPTDFWTRWAECQAQGVDLLLQPAQGRRKAMLLADMDSTMIDQECIDELAAEAGVGDRVADITARAMNGEIDFEAALDERVALLRGLPVTVIEDVLARRITLASGGAALVATMRAHGGYCALVSGGFTAFTRDIAARLGFDEHRANTLLAENGILTGAVARPVLGRQAKVDALTDITAQRGLRPADVLAVGDGANDLGMLDLAGAGVALHAKPAVAAQCRLRVNHGDLTALLYLQGYQAAEFVT